MADALAMELSVTRSNLPGQKKGWMNIVKQIHLWGDRTPNYNCYVGQFLFTYPGATSHKGASAWGPFFLNLQNIVVESELNHKEEYITEH